MALINDAKREINAKIVYMGPTGAGKATALRFIYSKLKPEYRSELKSTSLGEHQLLFFDFAYPQNLLSDGYSVRFHVYTILAGSGSLPPWRMLLKGVDGVVFLADSAAGSMDANVENGALFKDALAHYGITTVDVPLLLQCNKRDLAAAMPVGKMAAELFPELGEMALPVTAATGEGLLDGLNKVIREILQRLGRGETGFPEDSGAAGIAISGSEDETFNSAIGQDVTTSLSIEFAAAPSVAADKTLTIPLRVRDSATGTGTEFKVKISITR